MKRVMLFLATNLAVIVVLSVVLRLLGVERILDASGVGLDYQSLLIFAAVFGFGGAFISLMMSKWMAKMAMGVQVIEHPSNAVEQWLVDTVARLSHQAGIAMPEVGIYDAPEPNAFATGPSKNDALVAVSTGLLQTMTPEEVEAVLGHEIGHVANGDMVTLTLIQGVVNTFVIFIARVVGHVVDRVVFKNEEGHGPAFWITTMVMEILVGFLASMIVAWFSRQREFRADAAGAYLTSPRHMIAALERLRAYAQMPSLMPESVKAFGIRSGGTGSALLQLFATHPPLEERIEALQRLAAVRP